MLLLAVMWLVFGWALYSAWMAKLTHKAYDPFELLGVPSVYSSPLARVPAHS